MSRSFDGSTANYLRATFGAATTQPKTLFCWVNLPDWGAGNNSIMGLFQSLGIEDNHIRMFSANSPDDTVRFNVRTTTDISRDVTAAVADSWNNKWIAVMCAFDGTPDFGYEGWIEDVTQTNSVAASNRDIGDARELFIGIRADIAQAATGLLAEWCVWDGLRDGTDFTALVGGANPTTIDQANIRGYWSGLTDTGGTIPDESGNSGPVLNVVGSVPWNADHPAVDPPTPTEGIDGVNQGTDIVRRNFVGNEINGAGFTAATDVTIAGLSQANVVVVSDVLITFDTVIDNVADLKYGAQTLEVVRPTTNLSQPISLFPVITRSYVDVAGLPWNPASRSIFDGLSPAVSNGDQCEYDLLTDQLNSVSVNPDGTFLISGGGTLPQTFGYQVHRALDSNQWSSEFTAYVNFTPVITNVGVGNVSDIADTLIPVDGDHFGESQLASKVYLNMVGTKNGNEVEQTVTSWSNDQIILTDWTLGAIPGGTNTYEIVEAE